MKISIITPFKNSKLWLDRCAKSMHENDGDFEFIFVDDHSDDGGWGIIEGYEFKDDRFIMLNNMHDPGVGGARNTGLDAATGDYIAFIDADDELVQNVYPAIKKELKTTANIHQFNHQRQYARTGKIITKYKNTEGWYHSPDLPSFWFLIWNKVFRKEFLNDIYFDEDMSFGEDELFCLKCLSKDDTMHSSNDILTRHHFDNKNSLSKSKKKEDLIRHLDRLNKFIAEETNPKLIKTVCNRLAEYYKTDFYVKGIGGDIDGL